MGEVPRLCEEKVRFSGFEFEADMPGLRFVLEHPLPEQEKPLGRFSEHERTIVMEILDGRLEVEDALDVYAAAVAQVCVIAEAVRLKVDDLLFELNCVCKVVEEVHSREPRSGGYL